ncbi:MAG: hypothetical protein HUU15_17415, partial [Candidatus Brocadiae bacterium]|nr:hypothetical protein [Candidatus Brocadiia bacterium]
LHEQQAAVVEMGPRLGENHPQRVEAVVPGGEPPGASGPAGVHIAQYADPPATGQFVFEFVEIRWDGN